MEVFWHYQWSTVCHNSWDNRDAIVVCKQFGYPGGHARHSSFFGPGTGVILLDRVSCSGNEPNIFSCRHTNFGENNCGHRQDAGVVCTARGTKM